MRQTLSDTLCTSIVGNADRRVHLDRRLQIPQSATANSPR